MDWLQNKDKVTACMNFERDAHVKGGIAHSRTDLFVRRSALAEKQGAQ